MLDLIVNRISTVKNKTKMVSVELLLRGSLGFDKFIGFSQVVLLCLSLRQREKVEK